MPPHDDLHFTKEALQSLDGLILPITIDVDGEKQTVGVAALSFTDGSVHVAGEITDPRLAEIIQGQDAAYFSAPGIPPIELPSKLGTPAPRWQEGLFDGGD